LRGANLAQTDLAGVTIDAQTQLDKKWRRVCEIARHGAVEEDLTGWDLSQTIFRDISLAKAKLLDTDLTGTSLQGVDLRGTEIDVNPRIDDKWKKVWEIVNQENQGRNLAGVDLSGAYMPGANLVKANLSRANLSGADLTGVDFRGANLSEAYLERINLEGANLSGANLRRAVLIGANLSKTTLTEVRLEWAIYSKETQWPQDFEPEKFGAYSADTIELF
jgi:uncharacterized protein YjbI with pentapeptide repeats